MLATAMADAASTADNTPLVATKSPTPATGRPGTSGTELNLRSDRQKAQTSYQRAAQAEQAYRAKRRATYARKDIKSAGEHFSASATSFREGCKCAWSAVLAGPAVVKEKQVKRREEGAEKKRNVAEAKKKKWEEKAKKNEDSESPAAPAEATPAAEATPGAEATPAAEETPAAAAA
ncbi:hypothetical protein LZ554_006063 [Drepanopeziza brunnea f. sp. 'monogermtubi']|nr:hypothetical protein LZ554_006063 [Drepanopeziza brunnea f. sp. 'monogermtubi']